MKYSIFLSYLVLASLVIAPNAAHARPSATLDFKATDGTTLPIDVAYPDSPGGNEAYECMLRISASNIKFPKAQLERIKRIDIAKAKFFTKGTGTYVGKQYFGKKYVVTLRVDDSFDCGTNGRAFLKSLDAVQGRADHDERKRVERLDPEARKLYEENQELKAQLARVNGLPAPADNPAGGVTDSQGTPAESTAVAGTPAPSKIAAESAILIDQAVRLETEAAAQPAGPGSAEVKHELLTAAQDLRLQALQKEIASAKEELDAAKTQYDSIKGTNAKPEVVSAVLNRYTAAVRGLALANAKVKAANLKDEDGTLKRVPTLKPNQIMASKAEAEKLGAATIDDLKGLEHAEEKEVAAAALRVDSADDKNKTARRRELASSLSTALTAAQKDTDRARAQERVSRLTAFALGRSEDLSVEEDAAKETALVKGEIRIKSIDAPAPAVVAAEKKALDIPPLASKPFLQTDFPSSGGEDEAYDFWSESEKKGIIPLYPRVIKPDLDSGDQIRLALERKARKTELSSDKYKIAQDASNLAYAKAYEGYVSAKRAMDNEDSVGEGTLRHRSAKWAKINGYEDATLAYFRARVEHAKATLEQEIAANGRDSGDLAKVSREYDEAVNTLNSNIAKVNEARKQRLQYHSYFDNHGSWARQSTRWARGWSRPAAADTFGNDGGAMSRIGFTEEPKAVKLDDEE